MTARTAAAVASLALALTVSACNDLYEVPIETPIQPKMDVSPFQRVLIAGFLAGGSEDVDANLETVRLLRSQLRSKSQLKVIDADVLPLLELANEQRTDKGETGANGASPATTPAGGPTPTPASNTTTQAPRPRRKSNDVQQSRIKDEKDLRAARGHLRQRRLLEEDRRGIPEPADRHRLGAVHRRTRDRASCSASRK